MENKINIAELLKDCPQGMELDCTMYENASFEEINNSHPYPIVIRVGKADTICLTKEGNWNKYSNAKCVIFPKGKTTWEGFHRPFKDGDILTNGDIIFIYNGFENDLSYGTYAIIGYYETFNLNMPTKKYNTRFATEEEKQKLFDAIKANGYKWNKATKTLDKLVKPKFKVGDRIKNGKNIATIVGIYEDFYDVRFDSRLGSFTIDLQDEWELALNKFDINTFKPFDKVLVRDNINEKWNIHFFSYINDAKIFKTIMGEYIQCIPYEGNEHLLGTTNDCDEFYKTWEK